MMTRGLTSTLLVTLASALIALAWGTPALAGTQDGAVVALHAAPHPLKGGDPCVMEPVDLPCAEFTTSWPLFSPCDVYLVIARGDPGPGIAALSFGVRFNQGETGEHTNADGVGVDLYSFSWCASGLEWPSAPIDWPHPSYSGGGTRLTWDAVVDCQRTTVASDGVHALAGSWYLYAYSDDLFEVTPNPPDEHRPVEEFQVGDCSDQLTDLTYPLAAGAVAFGSGTGRNPCLAIPVRPTSWSRIKGRY